MGLSCPRHVSVRQAATANEAAWQCVRLNRDDQNTSPGYCFASLLLAALAFLAPSQVSKCARRSRGFKSTLMYALWEDSVRIFGRLAVAWNQYSPAAVRDWSSVVEPRPCMSSTESHLAGCKKASTRIRLQFTGPRGGSGLFSFAAYISLYHVHAISPYMVRSPSHAALDFQAPSSGRSQSMCQHIPCLGEPHAFEGIAWTHNIKQVLHSFLTSSLRRTSKNTQNGIHTFADWLITVEF